MTLSENTIYQTAIQMVILDIFEKDPKADPEYLIKYMKTLSFENQLREYVKLLNAI